MAINYEVEEGIAYISFCRPEKHNALRDEDIKDIANAVARLDRDQSANIGIIHGGAGPSFSSGADTTDRLQRSIDEKSPGWAANEADAFLSCENWKPIVAAVHGYCLGHALGTANHCDLIVASRDAKFQVTEIVIGVPTSGSMQRLGLTQFAADVCLTGRFFTADEAYQAGMIARLVDKGKHLSGAVELAHQILAHPQGAVREVVRARRSLVAEQAVHARSVAGTYKWAEGSDAKDRIAAKVAGKH
jgi:enoyl-CoA hydratase/carnithine racemase